MVRKVHRLHEKVWGKYLFTLIGLSCATCVIATTDGQQLPSNEPRGYHWYQHFPSEAEKKEDLNAQHPKPIMPSHAEMMAMHPQKIRALLDQHREYAIYTLQPADVLNYQKIQDVARRKSEAFAAVSSMVLMQNPRLNAQSAIPTSNPGVAAQRKQGYQAIVRVLAAAKEQFALGFFSAPGCRYCQVQRETLQQFQKQYGWKIKEFNVATHGSLAEKFNVELTPSLVVIKKNSTGWMPISVGVEPLSIVEQNLFRAIRLLNGNIKPQQFFMGEQEQGGFADPLAGVSS